MLSYFQAIVLGLIQGVSELFPISSLGQTVILPSLFGWKQLVALQASTHHSFFLSFLVALHVGTAIALFIYFRHDWVRIISAILGSAARRRIETPDERLGWLLVVATIPAGLVGLVFEKLLRVLFATPLAAAIFLVLNGIMLLGGDAARRASEQRALRRARRAARAGRDPSVSSHRRLDTLEFKEALVIGVAQVLALFAGISRSGVTMVAGLVRGMDHEDSARFSFLLATPIIFAAGLYKLPELLSPLAAHVRGQAAVGGVVAGVAAFFSTRFLMRWFETKKLWPFAVYCIVFGVAMIFNFA